MREIRQSLLSRQPILQVPCVLLKGMEANLLPLRDIFESSVVNDNTIIPDQSGHRHEQFDSKCIGSHFNQAVAIGPTTFKSGEAAQPSTIEQQVAKFVSERHPAATHTGYVLTRTIEDDQREVSRSAHTEA